MSSKKRKLLLSHSFSMLSAIDCCVFRSETLSNKSIAGGENDDSYSLVPTNAATKHISNTMYTWTQIERQLDPGRSCTDATAFEYNGGKLNCKSFLFLSHLSCEYYQFC